LSYVTAICLGNTKGSESELGLIQAESKLKNNREKSSGEVGFIWISEMMKKEDVSTHCFSGASMLWERKLARIT